MALATYLIIREKVQIGNPRENGDLRLMEGSQAA